MGKSDYLVNLRFRYPADCMQQFITNTVYKDITIEQLFNSLRTFIYDTMSYVKVIDLEVMDTKTYQKIDFTNYLYYPGGLQKED